MNKKYIFVVGGVMSGVGKGITTSSIGKIMQSRGFKVTAMKIDPYINIDAGTMNPTEHGEVFVLNDGDETDQDMGNYERFLGVELSRSNYMTTGRVYQTVIQRERNLEYGGRCVEVVPHIPQEIIARIEAASKKANADVTIVEIGGTIGEYQNILFLEAARMMRTKYPDDIIVVLVSYLPIPRKVGEMKTKPTQYAARSLNSVGIQPDVIIARSAFALDKKRKEKIATFCSIREEDVISAPDVESVYEVPVNFEKDHLSNILLKKLNLKSRRHNMKEWEILVKRISNARKTVRIGVIGKYFATGDFILTDSYISVIEAIRHAGYLFGCVAEIDWISSEDFEKDSRKVKKLDYYDGIVIPGGFGSRGIEGKIKVVRYCRENKIPYFGLCYGMQIAVIEYARNVLGLKDAHTTEIKKDTKHPVIDFMPDQEKKVSEKNYGGSMRLGAYPAILLKDSIASKAYGEKKISERHRHRYEVNPKYITQLEKSGLVFSGKSPSGVLMEIVELPHTKHPFFVGTQFHPEFQSSPLTGHPLYVAFMKAALSRKRKNKYEKRV